MIKLQKDSVETVTTHQFAVLGTTVPYKISIVFKNGEFFSCSFPFSGRYNMEHWLVLKTIAETILTLEEQISGKVFGKGEHY